MCIYIYVYIYRERENTIDKQSIIHTGQTIAPEAPLKVHWTLPVTIQWESDNPFEHISDK